MTKLFVANYKDRATQMKDDSQREHVHRYTQQFLDDILCCDGVTTGTVFDEAWVYSMELCDDENELTLRLSATIERKCDDLDELDDDMVEASRKCSQGNASQFVKLPKSCEECIAIRYHGDDHVMCALSGAKIYDESIVMTSCLLRAKGLTREDA